MKNKTIKLFEEEFENEIDGNEVPEKIENDLFGEEDSPEEEGTPKEDKGLEKLLKETSGLDELDSILTDSPIKNSKDKSIFTFDNDEWNTMGKA